jgi:hypothetical protein
LTARLSSSLSSTTDSYDCQTTTVIAPKSSIGSTDYKLGRKLIVIRIRSSINTDANAAENHSSTFLSLAVVDVSKGSQWTSSQRISYIRVPTTRSIFLARIFVLLYIFLGNISFFSLSVLALLADYALFLFSCICVYYMDIYRWGEASSSGQKNKEEIYTSIK